MTPGSDQPVSRTPKCLKDNKDHGDLLGSFSLFLWMVQEQLFKACSTESSWREDKTGKKITAQLWTLTCYMRYAQSPVLPQSQPSVLPGKASVRTGVPKTGMTQSYQFPQKIQVVNLILVFLSHTWTNRSMNQEEHPQSMNIYGWRRHQCFSITSDTNMMKTWRMVAEAETKVSPFPSFPTKQ